MTSPFYIAHATPGRTRIRWAGDSAQKNIVSELATDIANIQGVDGAEPRIMTGSIIIKHDGQEWPTLQSQLTDLLSLQFTAAPPAIRRNGVQSFNDNIDNIDGALRHVNMDFNSFTLVILCALAIVQALRGQVMSSSVSVLWYAFTIASMVRDREAKDRDENMDIPE